MNRPKLKEGDQVKFYYQGQRTRAVVKSRIRNECVLEIVQGGIGGVFITRPADELTYAPGWSDSNGTSR